MVKDTKVQELIINELTKSRYEQMKDSGTLNENELYMVTDEEYVSPEDLATVATTGDYNDLTNTPDLANVATSGDYNDLSNTPDLATVATTGDYNDLSNIPTIPVVDQTYDSTSTNAQSGVAVAEALETVTIDIDNDTITRNNSEELQSVGIINPRTNTSLKIWEGSEYQWENGKPETWYYWETDTTAGWETKNLPTLPDSSFGPKGYGNGTLIMPDSNSGTIAYSRDLGETWTYVETPLRKNLGYVTYLDENNFVVTSSNPNMSTSSAYSSDGGETWLTTSMPLVSYHGYRKPVYKNGILILTGDNSNNIGYSTTKGRTWSTSSFPVVSSTTPSWSTPAYGSNVFVAIYQNSNGLNKAAYSIDDCRSWELSDLPSSSSNNAWIEPCYGNGVFVTIRSGTTQAAYTYDGITWEETTLPSAVTSSTPITYGNGMFVILEYNKVIYSSDGIAWNSYSLPVSRTWTDLIFADEKFLAISNNYDTAIYSANGINWQQTIMPSSSYWSNLIYADGKFLTSGSSSGLLAFSMSVFQCFTKEEIPTSSSIVYSKVNIPSGYSISSVGSNSITLSDGNVYNYLASGNQYTYETIGNAYPDWLCNIEGVGVKIGNTIIANNTTSAEWGNITGDLDDQLDLKNALGEKSKVSIVDWETDTTTDLETLIINKLSKQQYDQLPEKADDELYMITSTEDDRIIVDDELDGESENPVQNKVITTALGEKVDSSSLATVATTGDYNDLTHTLTAGIGISIDNGVINNTQTSAEWGNIEGDITEQSDLQNALGEKVDSSSLATVATSGDYNDLINVLTAGTLINIDSNNEISTSASKVSYKDWDGSSSTTTDISNLIINNLTQEEYDDLVENDQINDNELYMILNSNYVTQSELEEVLSGKQDTLTAGAGISINNNVISTNGNVIKIVDDTPLLPEDGVVYFIKESE